VSLTENNTVYSQERGTKQVQRGKHEDTQEHKPATKASGKGDKVGVCYKVLE